MPTYRELIEQYLGAPLGANDTSTCPCARCHTNPSGPRDMQWRFAPEDTEKPHAHCLHSSCASELDAWFIGLYQWLNTQRGGGYRQGTAGQGRGQGARPLPAAPKKGYEKTPALDPARAARLAELCPQKEITHSMLLSASPVPIPKNPATHGALMIDTLYNPGEHILVFTRFASQGQYLKTAGGSTYKLASRPGVRAVRSPRLPLAGPEGVWYLAAPVLGTWQPNPFKKDAVGNLLPGRRHAACATRFPYLVLESDTVPGPTWLRILVQLAAPIAAIYTSGGKSYHALIHVGARTKEEFNAVRRQYIARLCPVGADAGAITAVRLSRLPGCLRRGTTNAQGQYIEYDRPRLQQLLYLAPHPDPTPIMNRLHPTTTHTPPTEQQ